MTDDQFRVLKSVHAAVSAVADRFGSEATSSGLVLPTRTPSLAEACREWFPSTYTVHPLGFEAFAARYAKPADEPAIHRFVTLARHLQPEAAYLAPHGFDRDAHSRGAFFLAIYLDALEAMGTRAVIAFERVET